RPRLVTVIVPPCSPISSKIARHFALNSVTVMIRCFTASAYHATGQMTTSGKLLRDGFRNRLSVKAAVLNNNLVAVNPRHDHARKIHSGAAALERLGIRERLLRLRLKLDSMRRKKLKVRPVSGHGEYKIVRQRNRTAGRNQVHVPLPDLFDGGMEVRLDL